jgi:hypothetical protein
VNGGREHDESEVGFAAAEFKRVTPAAGEAASLGRSSNPLANFQLRQVTGERFIRPFTPVPSRATNSFMSACRYQSFMMDDTSGRLV